MENSLFFFAGLLKQIQANHPAIFFPLPPEAGKASRLVGRSSITRAASCDLAEGPKVSVVERFSSRNSGCSPLLGWAFLVNGKFYVRPKKSLRKKKKHNMGYLHRRVPSY